MRLTLGNECQLRARWWHSRPRLRDFRLVAKTSELTYRASGLGGSCDCMSQICANILRSAPCYKKRAAGSWRTHSGIPRCRASWRTWSEIGKDMTARKESIYKQRNQSLQGFHKTITLRSSSILSSASSYCLHKQDHSSENWIQIIVGVDVMR